MSLILVLLLLTGALTATATAPAPAAGVASYRPGHHHHGRRIRRPRNPPSPPPPSPGPPPPPPPSPGPPGPGPLPPCNCACNCTHCRVVPPEEGWPRSGSRSSSASAPPPPPPAAGGVFVRPRPRPAFPGLPGGGGGGSPTECVTALAGLMPCGAFLTGSETETPTTQSDCCVGLGGFLNASTSNDRILRCLCPVILGDVNKMLPKPIDPVRLMYLPIACGIVLPPQVLYICFTGQHTLPPLVGHTSNSSSAAVPQP